MLRIPAVYSAPSVFSPVEVCLLSTAMRSLCSDGVPFDSRPAIRHCSVYWEQDSEERL
jgi:hypothetical protein